jgi:membrane protein YdbS with pleckstrin-like domain
MAATNTSPIGPSEPVMTVNTVDLAPAAPQASAPDGQELYPEGAPAPRGTDVVRENEASREDSSDPAEGAGVDGELSVWEARYSKRNFIGRISFRVVLTIAVGVLAYYTWAAGHDDLAFVSWIAIGVAALLWVGLIYRMIQAHYSHYYRLTNRRLFVSTGIINRRRDMLELLRVKDVFARQQSLLERWMSLGTVVVEPNDKSLPTFYLAGVDDPKEVMDLIWHHARAERDHRSVKVDSV